MRSKFLSLLLLIVLLGSAACTPQVTPAAATTAPTTEAPTEVVVPTSVPPTEVPTQVPPEPKTLTVLAAASLTESFTELGGMFEAQNPEVTVSTSFAGSQQLAEQLGQGAEADVFASASKKYMDAAIEAKRVNKDDAKTFVKNRLVVIFPKDNPGGLKELKDLANPGLKLDLAAESVPVGKYSLEFLDKAIKDPGFDPQFKDNVIKNVVSYEDNVKAVVTKVSLGEADAGIVYVTDVTADAAEKVDKLDIPDALNSVANYPIAAISDSKNAELAKAFVELVLSADGQQVMAKYGFIPAGASASAGGSFKVTDAMGREITFEKVPQKIVLVGKALFMVADAIYMFPEAGKNISALGSTEQGSGNFVPMIDATYSEKISVPSDAGTEEIAATQPDCVIMKSMNAEKIGTPLEELKIPVVYLDFETSDQYKRDLMTLGQLFQNPKRAEEVAAYYQGKVDSISQAVSSLKDEEKPRTLILYYSDKDGEVAFNVPPMGWMQTFLVQTAGGLPVWEDANPSKGWTKVNLEQVAAWNPDIIFVIAYFNPLDEVVNNMKADPQFMNLDAVKNDKVYGFAKDVYSWDQPDTRWILGLGWAANKLHPDLFPNYDISAEAKAFYKNLYGMDDASFEKNIQPILMGDVH